MHIDLFTYAEDELTSDLWPQRLERTVFFSANEGDLMGVGTDRSFHWTVCKSLQFNVSLLASTINGSELHFAAGVQLGN